MVLPVFFFSHPNLFFGEVLKHKLVLIELFYAGLAVTLFITGYMWELFVLTLVCVSH